ncbi:uncharacterized protein LOC135214368 [Macrobrachium nipponense]|uniref:uncharacterized protein LOC135214368 n=1 Tax=Macrobrachium nipponense TaxID=159736 RepID=UPI0030C87F96
MRVSLAKEQLAKEYLLAFIKKNQDSGCNTLSSSRQLPLNDSEMFNSFAALGERLFSRKTSRRDGGLHGKDDDTTAGRKTFTLPTQHRNGTRICGRDASERKDGGGNQDSQTSKGDISGANDNFNNTMLSCAASSPCDTPVRGCVPSENTSVVQSLIQRSGPREEPISIIPSIGPRKQRPQFLDVKSITEMPGKSVLSGENSPSEEFYDAQDELPSQEPLAVVGPDADREEPVEVVDKDPKSCNEAEKDVRPLTETLPSEVDDGEMDEFQDAMDSDVHSVPQIPVDRGQRICDRSENDLGYNGECYKSPEQIVNQDNPNLNFFSLDNNKVKENSTPELDIPKMKETNRNVFETNNCDLLVSNIGPVGEVESDKPKLRTGTLTESNESDNPEESVSSLHEINGDDGELEVKFILDDVMERNEGEKSPGNTGTSINSDESDKREVNLCTDDSGKVELSTDAMIESDKGCTIEVNTDNETERERCPFDVSLENTRERNIVEIKHEKGTDDDDEVSFAKGEFHNGLNTGKETCISNNTSPSEIVPVSTEDFAENISPSEMSHNSSNSSHFDNLKIAKKPPIAPTQAKNNNGAAPQKPSRILTEFKPLQRNLQNSRLREETRQIVMMLENDKACKVPRPNLGLQDRLKSLMKNSVAKKPRSCVKGPRFCGTYVKGITSLANEKLEARRDSFQEFIQQRKGIQCDKPVQNPPSLSGKNSILMSSTVLIKGSKDPVIISGKNTINEDIGITMTSHTETVYNVGDQNAVENEMTKTEIKNETKSFQEELLLSDKGANCDDRIDYSSPHHTNENISFHTANEPSGPFHKHQYSSACYTEPANDFVVLTDKPTTVSEKITTTSDTASDQSTPHVDDSCEFKLQSSCQPGFSGQTSPDAHDERSNASEVQSNISDSKLFENHLIMDQSEEKFTRGDLSPDKGCEIGVTPVVNGFPNSETLSKATGSPGEEAETSGSKTTTEAEPSVENRKRKANRHLPQQQPSKKSLTSIDLQKHIASLNKVSKEMVSKQSSKDKDIGLKLASSKDTSIKSKSPHIQKEVCDMIGVSDTDKKDFVTDSSLHSDNVKDAFTRTETSHLENEMDMNKQISKSSDFQKNLTLHKECKAKPSKESVTDLPGNSNDRSTCTENKSMSINSKIQEYKNDFKTTIIEADITRLKMDNLVARHCGAHFIYKKTNDMKRDNNRRAESESRSLSEAMEQRENSKIETDSPCHSAAEKLPKNDQIEKEIPLENRERNSDYCHVRSRYSSVDHRRLCQSKSRRNTIAQRRFSCFPDGKNSRSSQSLINKGSAKVNCTSFTQTMLKKCLEIAIDKCESMGWEAPEEISEAPSEISKFLSLEEMNKELARAVAKRNAGRVRELLKQGADPNILCGHSPALLRAAKDGMLYIVQALIAAGAEIDVRLSSGDSVVHVAARGGHSEVIIDLIHSGAHVDAINRNGVTPLQTALAYGHLEVAQMLLRMHADILAPNKVGETALEIANNLGYIGLTGKPRELRRDSAPGTRVEVPPTEVPVAVRMIQGIEEGCAATVEECLNLGAHANTVVPLALHWPARAGVLHRASHHGEDLIVKLLLAGGADINMRDVVGNTPLHAAAQAGYNKVVKVLLANGAQLDSVSQSGMTPLHRAASKGKDLTCNLLLKRGADPKTEDNAGCTPADWARKRGFKSLAKRLFYRRRSSTALTAGANHKHQLQHLSRLHQAALKAGQRSNSMESEE